MPALFDGFAAAAHGLRFAPGDLPTRGWGVPLWPLVAAVLISGLVAAVIVLSVRLARRGRRPSEGIEIAKARYARGEISKGEYEELKRDLS